MSNQYAASGVPYEGASGGLVGALARVRARKQLKYSNEGNNATAPRERYKQKYAHHHSNQTLGLDEVLSMLRSAKKGKTSHAEISSAVIVVPMDLYTVLAVQPELALPQVPVYDPGVDNCKNYDVTGAHVDPEEVRELMHECGVDAKGHMKATDIWMLMELYDGRREVPRLEGPKLCGCAIS